MKNSRAALVKLSLAFLLVLIPGAFYYVSLPEPGLQHERVDAEDDVARLEELRALLNAKEERERTNKEIWYLETQAQEYEQTIIKFWDQMLSPEDDKYAVLASIPFQTITLPNESESEVLPHDIVRTEYQGTWKTMDHEGWRIFLESMEQQEFEITAIEFHQSKFELDADKGATSVFSVPLFVTNKDGEQRWAINATLRVEWSRDLAEDGTHIPRELVIERATILEREAPRTFEPRVIHGKLSGSVPAVYDLNGDGFSDILIPERNTLYQNSGTGEFSQETLFADLGEFESSSYLDGVVVADFTGDGVPDILCTTKAPAQTNLPEVVLFRGNDQGNFDTAPTYALLDSFGELKLDGRFVNLTAGDIDGDGDLDVWLSQYRDVYNSGQFPTPYFDSNDGYPSYLLLNDGNGNFSDGTEAANLADKRHRRTFSASFVDLDDDRDLDLLVVNDFAGIDIHVNDGTGKFSDQTRASVDEVHSFGMGHAYGDFDLDGELDFYVTGMSSTTARRLEFMDLGRDDFPEYDESRMKMAHGNRMYLNRGAGSYREPKFKDSVARTGWAWGTTAADFDNDGDVDVYVANGHRSGKSTKDYCTNFWCNDIFSAGTDDDSGLIAEVMAPVLNGLESWDGYQKNNLLMNMDGKDFLNVAFLMDVALENDSRSVVADDFNSDGRVDLLVKTTNEGGGKQLDRAAGNLYLLENHWPVDNNWIGVRLREEPGKPSPIGARIEATIDGKVAVAKIVTGDSFRSQHANVKHFGIGSSDRVSSITVSWLNGEKVTLTDPAINTYHEISAAGDNR